MVYSIIRKNNTQVVETFVDGNCGISSVSEQIYKDRILSKKVHALENQ